MSDSSGSDVFLGKDSIMSTKSIAPMMEAKSSFNLNNNFIYFILIFLLLIFSFF